MGRLRRIPTWKNELIVSKAKFVDVEAPSAEWRLIHRQADRLVPVVRTAFVRAVEAVARATPWEDITARLTAGRLDVEDLVPWNSVGIDALMNPFTRIFQQGFERTGQLVARQLQLHKRYSLTKQVVRAVFEPGQPRAAQWAGSNAAARVVEINDETLAGIRAAVVRGFEEGVPPRVLARDLRQVVGLNARFARAVINRRIRLIAAGMDPVRLTREIDRYARRLLRVRTESIARTETIRASTEGQLESWRQNREAGLLSRALVKEWIVTPDDRLCPICAPLAGVQADVDGLFTTTNGRVSGPPAHQQCRCSLGLAIERRAA